MFERVCTLKKETFPGTLLPGSFCNQEIGHVQFLSSEILLVSVPLLLAGFSYQAIWLLLNSQWNSKFSSFWVLQCSHCENQRKTVGTFCEGLHNKQPIMLHFFFFFVRGVEAFGGNPHVKQLWQNLQMPVLLRLCPRNQGLFGIFAFLKLWEKL